VRERPGEDLVSPPGFEPLGDVEAVEHMQSGVRLRTASALVEITALAADLFRVGMFVDGRPSSYGSEAIAKHSWEFATLELHESHGELGLVTSRAAIVVTLRPLRIGFEDARGRKFAQDDEELGMGILRRPGADPRAPDVIGPPVRVYKQRPSTERNFACGERTGGLEKTGTHQVFWNIDPPKGHSASQDNLYTSLPFLLALDQGNAWGLFLDNSHRVEFDLGRDHPHRSWFGASGGDLVYYVFAGPTPKDVLGRYTELTGHTPLPPLWALGNHQSRWGYASADDIREIARGFRERDIPCDALYLDIDYMDGYRVFTFDGERFPDPAGLAAEMREQGIRLVAIVDPGVKVDDGYHVYASGREQDVYGKTSEGEEYQNVVWPGVCAFPDFTSSKTRKWWSELHASLFDAGIAGIWCDMNEPTVFIPRLATLPLDSVHPGDGEPRLHAQVHNLYGLLMARAAHESFETLRPDERPFVISRAGYAGLQRSALHWTGDNSSWWEHLWMSMPQLQNLGLSGLAWVGVDVGGFWEDCDGELLARWTEFGAFQPFCRNHSALGTRSQEPWAFGEPYESVIRSMLKLRQRLIPYLYTQFEHCHRSGAPVLRPLLFEYPEDERTYSADDQFMVGRDLLVAPITRRGASHRHVYLPAGTWFHWWSGKRVDGPADVLVEAPLGHPAIYVRANAPIPLWPEMNHVDERARDPLTICLYPAEGQGELTLYEDTGEGFGFQRGEYARTAVSCVGSDHGATITIGERQGAYDPARTTLVIELRGLREPYSTVRVDGGQWHEWRHDEGTLSISLPDGQHARTIEVHR
jgi:alpha-glucosidase